MTFDMYIYNPMGKGSVAMVAAMRDQWKEIYTRKFGEINLREAGDIKYFLYFDEKKDIYVVYAKIPSEVVKEFYYDVVIEFTSTDAAHKLEGNISKYDVKFYSNDPSFVFTYLKVFKDNSMFVEWLKTKSPKQALKKDPDIKNPYKIPGYVKSIYFTYLLMKNKQLFLKTNFKLYGKKLDTKSIEKQVMPAEKKIDLRIQKGEEVAKQKRKEKQKEKKEQESTKSKDKTSPISKAIKKVSTVANSKTTKTTKRKSKK